MLLEFTYFAEAKEEPDVVLFSLFVFIERTAGLDWVTLLQLCLKGFMSSLDNSVRSTLSLWTWCRQPEFRKLTWFLVDKSQGLLSWTGVKGPNWLLTCSCDHWRAIPVSDHCGTAVANFFPSSSRVLLVPCLGILFVPCLLRLVWSPRHRNSALPLPLSSCFSCRIVTRYEVFFAW